MDAVRVGWALGALVVALAVIAAVVTRYAALGDWRAPLRAAARATLQLAAVSLIIAAVLGSMALTFLFIALMTAVASFTSCRRLTGELSPVTAWLALSILAGVVPVLALSLASTAVPFEPVAVLPIAGILVGNAMVTTTLAGRRTMDALQSGRGLYDAALSLGLTRRQSVGLVGRPDAALALVPGLDQTRTVGLVTLPGAFVGVLIGGGSPIQAGAAQLLVLVGLLVVQAITAAVTVELIAAGRVPVSGSALRR